MNFKQVLQWIKQNPIAVGSAVICLASIIFLLVVRSKGNGLIAEAAARTQQIKRIESFNVTPMNLPPANVDSPPRVVNAPVNQAAIDYIKDIYGKMQADYAQILSLAESHNRGDAARGRHLPFMDGLFPDPGNRVYVLIGARQPYLNVFKEMLGPYAEGVQYPRLNAGGPVDRKRLEETAQNVERNFRLRISLGPQDTLTPAQQSQLSKEQQRAAIDLVTQHARSIHIYTSPEPFQIDPWATRIEIPRIEEVWESQLNLWIQQDIAQTIASTNRVNDPTMNVINAPIKRLNKIEVVPGYVGINAGGGITAHGAYGAPVSGDSKLPDNFSVAPTGRLSNTIYDIRHVWVDMDVDIQQLPIFMDKLVEINFMSVLKMEMTDVNEYALLNEGYFYGSADVVRIRMLVETLWLRSWTVPMMPKAVKELIGAAPATGS